MSYDPTLTWLAHWEKIQTNPFSTRHGFEASPCACGWANVFSRPTLHENLDDFLYPSLRNIVVEYLHHPRCPSVFDHDAFEKRMKDIERMEEEGQAFRFNTLAMTDTVVIVGDEKQRIHLLHYLLFRKRKEIFTTQMFIQDPLLANLVSDCFMFPALDTLPLARVKSRFIVIETTYQQTGIYPSAHQSLNVLGVAHLSGDPAERKITQSAEWKSLLFAGKHYRYGAWLLVDNFCDLPRQIQRQASIFFLLSMREETLDVFLAILCSNTKTAKEKIVKYMQQGWAAVVLTTGSTDDVQVVGCHTPHPNDLPFFRFDGGMWEMAAWHQLRSKET